MPPWGGSTYSSYQSARIRSVCATRPCLPTSNIEAENNKELACCSLFLVLCSLLLFFILGAVGCLLNQGACRDPVQTLASFSTSDPRYAHHRADRHTDVEPGAVRRR